MSVHLPPSVVPDDHHPSASASASEDEDEDDNDESWDDFTQESIAQQPCLSMFEDKTFPSITEALENDNSKFGFDINNLCSRLSTFF